MNNILLNIDHLSPDCFEWSFTSDEGDEISGICDTFEGAMIVGDREILLSLE